MSKRAINGILLLDKPIGISSNGALQRAKYALQAKKAGNTGSLDPLATGLLPLCFGEATKFSQYLLDADKHYRVTAQLGVATDTADSEGQVIARCDYSPEHTARLIEMIPSFIGASTQIPPMYSAFKHQGKPLYELARNGITIEREPRNIIIHSIIDVSVSDQEMSFSVHCSKGTYIRTLVEDIARAAGTLAHVTYLRRTGVGALPNTMITLDTVVENPQAAIDALIPVDFAIAHLRAQTLSAKNSQLLQQGVAISESNEEAPGLVRLYREDGQFFGIGEYCSPSMLKPVRLIQV